MILKDLINWFRIRRIAGNTLGNANEAETLEQAKKIIIKALKEHPELKGDILSEIGRQIDTNDKTPNVLMDKVAMGIIGTDELPNKIINREGVKEVLTDDGIQTLIEKGDIDLPLQRDLVNSITDEKTRHKVEKVIAERDKKKTEKEEKLKQEKIYNTLEKLYNNSCGKVSDEFLITQLIDLELNKKNDKINDKIKGKINDIIARQMAYNYIKFNGIIFSRFDKILSVEEMFSINFPKMIESEIKRILKKLNEEELKKIPKALNEFKGFSEEWRKKLLEEVADKIARRYTDTGIWNVPNSEEMRKISEEEEQFLINTIEAKIKENITARSLMDIKSQIRGKSNVNSIIETMIKSGLFESLLNMPIEEANKLIKVFTIFTRNKSHRGKGDAKQSEEQR